MKDFNMREFTLKSFSTESTSTLVTTNSQLHPKGPEPPPPPPPLTFYSIDKIKRQAHQEAWYGNSLNPFRRTRTWAIDGDTESLTARPDQRRDIRDVERISSVTSEPLPERQEFSGGDAISPSSAGLQSVDGKSFEMTSGLGNISKPERSSEKTAVDSQSTGRPPSEEQSARQRFINRLQKNKGDENDESRTTTGLSKPTSKISRKRKPFTLGNQLKATIFNSWINVLILAAPVGIALHFVDSNPVAIFVVNFIAIIPLAALLSYATEEIAIRVGETLGGLLNATFGNAVELIVSIIALTQKNYIVVKTSLIGSMLSNLLLVMGMCFFFGGLKREEQHFNVTVAQTAASLLALAIASIIVPSAFDLWTNTDEAPIAAISRGTSIILLVVYGCYLFFQLKTHAAMYNAESEKVALRSSKNRVQDGAIMKGLAAAGGFAAAQGRSRPFSTDVPPGDDIMQPDAFEQKAAREQVERDEPQLHILVAVFTLAAATVVIALCSEFMVDSINAVSGSVSIEFIGLILLPIVGNAAEHATAVTVACKDKMDLAIGVAVGSSMQIALLVLPFIVVLGWILGLDDMNLSFDGFQVAVLFVAVLLVNYLIADGKSHWLEGALLQALYLIIAVSAWFYP